MRGSVYLSWTGKQTRLINHGKIKKKNTESYIAFLPNFRKKKKLVKKISVIF